MQDMQDMQTQIFSVKNFQELHPSLLSVQGWSTHRCQVPRKNEGQSTSTVETWPGERLPDPVEQSSLSLHLRMTWKNV